MASRIIQLEQHVTDLIAAGEVVSRPSSVVKELVENSIDSGAGTITLEITAGGTDMIRVTDNGCGISRDDIRTAFLRHATSKLKNAGDLESISSLGFRGEALAAIAAVSRIKLLSREPSADEGVQIELDAGEVKNISPVGTADGTTIIVRDLFFNTPARQKFLKSDRSEAASITQTFIKTALSKPDISFRYIKDDVTVYHTPGDARVDSCIYSLFGNDFLSSLRSVSYTGELVSISGFVSSPEGVKGNRNHQFFFVNNRTCRGAILQAALEQGYKTYIPSGRFPACVLYLTVNPSDVDVNVHPAKSEIKFITDKPIFDGVHSATLDALMQNSRFNNASSSEPQTHSHNTGRYTQIVEPLFAVSETGHNDAILSKRYTTTADNNGMKSSISYIHADFESGSDTADSYTEHDKFSYADPHSFTVIGEAFELYIIAESNQSLWLLDKHAIHERLHFDVLRDKDYKPMSQTLITPIIFSPGHETLETLLQNSALLDSLGFSIELFSEDSLALRHIPAEINYGDTEFVLSEIGTLLASSASTETNTISNIYKTLACRAAIKAGSDTSLDELTFLAKEVFSGNVTHCPHGRPVAFEITQKMLNRSFGRP